jgi:hypothetical protein
MPTFPRLRDGRVHFTYVACLEPPIFMHVIPLFDSEWGSNPMEDTPLGHLSGRFASVLCICITYITIYLVN